MLAYLFVLFLVFCPTLIEVYYNKPIKHGKEVLFLYCIFFIGFIGLRKIGYDYDSYREIYEGVKNGIPPVSIDRGFEFLCNIAPSFRILLILIASLTILPLFLVIRLKSKYLFLPLLLFSSTFLFPTAMGQMRQGVAIFLMFLGYYYLKNHKVWFVVLWLVCCTLHSSAIIAVVLLISVKKQFSIYFYLIGIVGALLVSGILASIFEPYLSQLSLIEDSNVSDRLNYYNTTETAEGASVGFNTAVLIRCIVFYYYYRWLRKSRTFNDNGVLNLYYLSIIVYLVFGFMPQLAGRGSQYFVVFDLILIPLLIKEYTGLTRTFLLFAFIGLALLRYVQFFSDPFNRLYYVPYSYAF